MDDKGGEKFMSEFTDVHDETIIPSRFSLSVSNFSNSIDDSEKEREKFKHVAKIAL